MSTEPRSNPRGRFRLHVECDEGSAASIWYRKADFHACSTRSVASIVKRVTEGRSYAAVNIKTFDARDLQRGEESTMSLRKHSRPNGWS